jgi:hypothetical protein
MLYECKASYLFPLNESKLSDLSLWPSHRVQNLNLSGMQLPSQRKKAENNVHLYRSIRTVDKFNHAYADSFALDFRIWALQASS